MENYRYKAFISYRHVEPDRAYAKWLHKALETYKVPSDLVANGYQKRIGRVFRDEEELPASADLSSQINDALEQSEFLVVVCSPRIVTSIWCDAEVKKFRELGRHDKIIALLIEGEPQESFLPSLCEIRKHVIKEDGTKVEEIESVEPLAADVRSRPGESSRELKSLAKLRIAACLVGCKFDDLRKREMRRRQQFLVKVALVMMILMLGFAGLTVWAFQEKNRAEVAEVLAKNNEVKANEHARIAQENEEIAVKQKEIAEARKKELIEEKLVVVKKEINQAEEEKDYIRAINLNMEAIDLLNEIGEKDDSILNSLSVAIAKNRLRARIAHNEKSKVFQLSNDGRYLYLSGDNNTNIYICDIDKRILINKVPMPKGFDAICLYEDGAACVISSRSERNDEGIYENTVLWQRIDPEQGQYIEELVIKNANAVFGSHYKNRLIFSSGIFMVREYDADLDYQYAMYDVKTGKKMFDFNHTTDIRSSQAVMNDGKLLVVYKDNNEKYFYFKEGDEATQINGAPDEGRYYLHRGYLIFANRNKSKILFWNEPDRLLSIKGKYDISETGQIIYEGDNISPKVIEDNKSFVGVDNLYVWNSRSIHTQPSQGRTIVVREDEFDIISANERLKITVPEEINNNAVFNNLLITQNGKGAIEFWDLTNNSNAIYQSHLILDQMLWYVFNESNEYLCALDHEHRLHTYDLKNNKLLHVIDDFKELSEKIKIEIHRKSNRIFIRTAEKFEWGGVGGASFTPQNVYLYALQSGDRIYQNTKKEDAYYYDGEYLVSLNKPGVSEGRLYRGNNKEDEWSHLAFNSYGFKEIIYSMSIGEDFYVIPGDGEKEGQFLKINSEEKEVTNLGIGHPFSSQGVLNIVYHNDESPYVILSCEPVDNGKGEYYRPYYLYNIKDNTSVELDKSIFGESVEDVLHVDRDEIVFTSGYSSQKLLSYNVDQKNLSYSIQTSKNYSDPIIYWLASNYALLRSRIGEEATLLSLDNKQSVANYKMNSFHKDTLQYCYISSDEIHVRNLFDKDYRLDLEVKDYPNKVFFSDDGKKLYFTQKDGLYSYSFEVEEAVDPLLEVRKILDLIE